jgi:predicted DNA-binding transcriptional regulator AlpA
MTHQPTPPTDPRGAFLSLKEAAYLMGVTYKWLWDRIGKPNGPPFKKRGKLIKLPRDEFSEWSKQDEIP